MSAPAREFVTDLWGALPPGTGVICIWVFPDRISHWCSTVDEAVAAIEANKGRDCYIGVAASPVEGRGPHERGTAADTVAIVALWSDIDVRGDGHKGGKLYPPTLDDARKILPPDMPPTKIVFTGNGMHCWWLLREPLIFENDTDRREAAILARRWQALLRMRAAAHGWSIDSTHDLARVLRIPGTFNMKDPQNPKLVSVLKSCDRRYSVSELNEALDESGVPKHSSEPAPTARFGSATGEDLLIGAGREVDQEMIDRFCELDRKFRATWNKQRFDIEPRGEYAGQSEYELALCNFGLDAGLPEQVIVDMMIQHRRVHCNTPPKHPGYYRLTLDRAYKRGYGAAPDRSEVVFPSGRPAGAPAPTPTLTVAPEQPQAPAVSPNAPVVPPPADPVSQTPPPVSPGPTIVPPPGHAPQAPAKQRPLSAAPVKSTPATRAKACDVISEAIGIRVLRIVKITGKEPSYILELEGNKVVFPRVGALMSPTRFREELAGSVGILVRRFKPKDWDALVQIMLDACVEKEGGEELTIEGEIKNYIRQYLSDTNMVPDLREKTLQYSQQRRPAILMLKTDKEHEEQRVTINALDVEQYIRRTFAAQYSAKAVAAGLASIGAVSQHFVRGASKQSRWFLPTDEFPVSEWANDEWQKATRACLG